MHRFLLAGLLAVLGLGVTHADEPKVDAANLIGVWERTKGDQLDTLPKTKRLLLNFKKNGFVEIYLDREEGGAEWTLDRNVLTIDGKKPIVVTITVFSDTSLSVKDKAGNVCEFTRKKK